jgi:c-di-GMP-binding flagellar brake protein YcgR
MHDRREAPRYDVGWPLRAERAQAEIATGRVLNVSASGLLFVSPRRYEVGDMTEIVFSLDPFSSIHCVVRIVREGPPAEGCYAYGVEFNDMADQDRRLLKNALLAMLRSKLNEERESALAH